MRMHRYLYTGGLLAVLLIAGCPYPGGDLFDAFLVYPVIPYASEDGVDPDLLSLDVYVPESPPPDPMPVVIWVHGGAWRTGDKSHQMLYKPPLFTEAGYCFVSVNYRLSPDPPNNDPDRILYPVHEQDVAAAIAWVYDTIADYGGDPDRIALMGHSAGAHLVSLIATDESFLAAQGLTLQALKGVIALDTGGYDIPENLVYGPVALYVNAFGDDPLIWEAASPVHHVAGGKGIPPFFLVRRGAAYRQQLCLDFAAALDGIGVATTEIDATPYTHSQVNTAVGHPLDLRITPPLMQFLDQVFTAPGP